MKDKDVEKLNAIIDDHYSARIRVLDDRLEKLTEMHKAAKKVLPRKSKTVAWAIWLLQGASLAISNRIIDDLKNNRPFIWIIMNLRLQFEITEQIKYFRNLPHGRKLEVQEWFNRSDTYHFGNGNKPEYDRFKKTASNPSWDSNSKKLIGYLSGYNHPTYDIASSMFEYSSKQGSLEYYSLDSSIDQRSPSISIAENYILMTEAAFELDKSKNSQK